MLEEHDRLLNHRSEEEGMDMTDIHMMKVEDMNLTGIHIGEGGGYGYDEYPYGGGYGYDGYPYGGGGWYEYGERAFIKGVTGGGWYIYDGGYNSGGG
jgi:hypothetical protein